LSRTIAGLLPEGNRFVDVFAGRGNVTFAVMQLNDFQQYWMNDLQTSLFLVGLRSSNIFKYFGWPIPDFKDGHSTTMWKRRGLGLDPKYPWTSHTAMLEAYLCFSGGSWRKAGVRGLSSTRGGVSQNGFEKNVRMACALMTIHPTRITKRDYRWVLNQLGEGDVAYLDPPYHSSCDVRAYNNSMLDHRQMVSILKDVPYKWLLSEYEDPIYTDVFGPPFHRVEVQRVIKSNAGERGKKSHRAVECFWKNY